MTAQPTFKGFLKASGHAEIWDDTDVKKFQQFGWRTTTRESSYSSNTLIGNWNEERFDVKGLCQPKPLPSQFDHYFESTYRVGYSQQPHKVKVPLTLRETESRAFPSHQPELDTPKLKQTCNSFLTCSREAYGSPERKQTHLNEQK